MTNPGVCRLLVGNKPENLAIQETDDDIGSTEKFPSLPALTLYSLTLIAIHSEQCSTLTVLQMQDSQIQRLFIVEFSLDVSTTEITTIERLDCIPSSD